MFPQPAIILAKFKIKRAPSFFWGKLAAAARPPHPRPNEDGHLELGNIWIKNERGGSAGTKIKYMRWGRGLQGHAPTLRMSTADPAWSPCLTNLSRRIYWISNSLTMENVTGNMQIYIYFELKLFLHYDIFCYYKKTNWYCHRLRNVIDLI